MRSTLYDGRLDYPGSYVNSLGAGGVLLTLKHSWTGKTFKNSIQHQVSWPGLLSVGIGKTKQSSFWNHLPTWTNSFFVTLFLQFPLLILRQFTHLLWWFWKIRPSATRYMFSALFIFRFLSVFGCCTETLWKQNTKKISFSRYVLCDSLCLQARDSARRIFGGHIGRMEDLALSLVSDLPPVQYDQPSIRRAESRAWKHKLPPASELPMIPWGLL